MSEWQIKTPVAFLIFKRPEITEKVFAEIAKVKPPKLLVVADGPRAEVPGEADKCAATRSIIEKVDWKCEVLKNYFNVNLGCKQRVASGLDWVFDTVEEAIILEDDCVPHPVFFRFCEELLEKYRNDERIMVISGNNFQFGQKRTPYPYSYYFSRYNHVWGWASWRRAWKYYDVTMKLWPEICQGGWLEDLLIKKEIVSYWTKIFEEVYQGKIDTWDYQWTFACWIQKGLSILPNVNLVSNIGFGEGATHTLGGSPFANLPIGKMDFPLKHPPFIIRDVQTDAITHYRNFSPHISTKIKGYIMKWINLSKLGQCS